MKNIAVCFLVFAFAACSSRTEVETYYPSGEIETKYFVSKKDTAQMDGMFTGFYKNGQIKEQTSYKDGVIDGTRNLFYEDGKKMITETYRNGNFDGTYTSYHASGNMQSTGTYVKNIMSGLWHFYYDTVGEPIKESVTFADNVENGPFIEYYKTGEIAATGNYLNELEHGLTIVFDKNGDTLKRIEYNNGRPKSYKEYKK